MRIFPVKEWLYVYRLKNKGFWGWYSVIILPVVWVGTLLLACYLVFLFLGLEI